MLAKDMDPAPRAEVADAPSDALRAERSKFDLGGPPMPIDAGQIPWSYGEDRITAMVRDPDSAYLYWEITDEGIAAARKRLGPAGVEGWCNLRVYDTTGRAFDGTNANDYFDVGIDRADREYFLMVRRPTSSMHVEVGIKSPEGYFQPIARSGRADFPRSDPSPNTRLEWLTVTSDGAPPAATPCRSRYGGPEPSLPGRAGAGYVDVWRAAYAPTLHADPAPAEPQRVGTSASTVRRHVERAAEIERWWHLEEWRSEWRGGLRFERVEGAVGRVSWEWHMGPFPVDVEDPRRVVVELLNQAPVRLHAPGVDFTVVGPWRVTIRTGDGEVDRRVLGTWSMRWVSAITPVIERWGFAAERRRFHAFERGELLVGASEHRGLLERGASETLQLGASERMWLGASEWRARGASETLFLAASQAGGASAFWAAGSSERIGASERVRAAGWMGASEGFTAGGSGGVAASVGGIPQSAEAAARADGERWAARPQGQGR